MVYDALYHIPGFFETLKENKLNYGILFPLVIRERFHILLAPTKSSIDRAWTQVIYVQGYVRDATMYAANFTFKF